MQLQENLEGTRKAKITSPARGADAAQVRGRRGGREGASAARRAVERPVAAQAPGVSGGGGRLFT